MTPRTLHDQDISGLFAALGDQQDFVYLDTSMVDGANNRSLLFSEPVERLCLQAGEDRAAFLDQAAQWLDRGYYIAGWLGYELLHDELAIGLKNDATALADLGVYGAPNYFDHRSGENDFPSMTDSGRADATYRLANLRPTIEEEQYCSAIERILEYIAAGDTYQVNYTFKPVSYTHLTLPTS